MNNNDKIFLKNFIRITKVLADESRVRILRLAMEKELCVCQIIETIQLAPSTVSKHLLLLKQAGLVDSLKRGRWMHYRVASAERRSAAADILTLVRKALSHDIQIESDLKRLKIILKMNREDLCRRQIGRKK